MNKKVDGLPETASPRLTLQLSSPIETAVLSKVYTDLDTAISKDSAVEVSQEKESVVPPANDKGVDDNVGAFVTFKGVETGQATLSIEATDADIPLGSSSAYDLAPYTSRLLDAMSPTSEVYSASLQVPILAPNSTNEDPICSVYLKLSYTPSSKDKREELFELLNKVNENKAVAIEKLRQSAMAKVKAGTEQQITVAKPAVKPGFLNKKGKEVVEEKGIVAWYKKFLGPNSMIRTFLPVAKNYIIFFGFVAFSHFKGQVLTLPPPV